LSNRLFQIWEFSRKNTDPSGEINLELSKALVLWEKQWDIPSAIRKPPVKKDGNLDARQAELDKESDALVQKAAQASKDDDVKEQQGLEDELDQHKKDSWSIGDDFYVVDDLGEISKHTIVRFDRGAEFYDKRGVMYENNEMYTLEGAKIKARLVKRNFTHSLSVKDAKGNMVNLSPGMTIWIILENPNGEKKVAEFKIAGINKVDRVFISDNGKNINIDRPFYLSEDDSKESLIGEGNFKVKAETGSSVKKTVVSLINRLKKKIPEIVAAQEITTAYQEPNRKNEDVVLVDDKLKFIMVADGMGGHAAGEVASNIAREVMGEVVAQGLPNVNSVEDLQKLLEDGAIKAHRVILDNADRNSGQKGMGATLSAGVIWADASGRQWFVGLNIGDSRICLRAVNGQVEQLSKDDNSMAGFFAMFGNPSFESIANSKNNKILFNEARRSINCALGHENEFGFSVQAHQRIARLLNPGDMIIIMSDGISDNLDLDPKAMQRISKKHNNPASLAKALKDEAMRIINNPKNNVERELGKKDDISVVVMRVPSASSAIEEQEPKENISSSLNSAQGFGGIDFRSLPIVTESIASLRIKLLISPSGGLQNLNLSRQWQELRRLLEAGITPSTERVKEYLQAACLNNCLETESSKIVTCIADILRSEEEQCYSSDPALTEILVVLESGVSEQELKEIFPGA